MSETGSGKRLRPSASVAAGLILAAVGLAACGRTTSTSDGTSTTASPDPSSGPTTTISAPRPTPPDPNPELALEWTEASISGVESVDQIIATSEGFIAYRFDDTPVAFTSPDGIGWTQRTVETDYFISSDVVRGGPGFVAFGSSGQEGEDDDRLMTSADGAVWSAQPIDLEPPELGVFSSYDIDGLAVSDDGFVITGILYRGEGGPDEHKFVTWASDDGSAWTLANDPFPPGSFVHDVLGVGDGFLAHDSTNVFTSQDGLSWSQVGSPWGDTWLAHPGLVWKDGSLVAAAPDAAELWMADSAFSFAEKWDLSTLPGSEDFGVQVETVAAGPMGIVLAGYLASPQCEGPPPDIVISKEGVEVTIGIGEEGFVLTVIDEASGALLVEVVLGGDEWDAVVVELDDGTSILDPGTSDEIVFISNEEADDAREKAYRDLGCPDPAEAEEPARVLWFSPEGETWTIIDLAETFGLMEQFGINDWPESIVVGRDTLILRWSGWQLGVPEDEDPEHEPPGLIWVGRLANP